MSYFLDLIDVTFLNSTVWNTEEGGDINWDQSGVGILY